MLAAAKPLPNSSNSWEMRRETIEDDDPYRVDARLRSLNERVLPAAPYLLTVPSDVPYHVSPYQQNNWRVGLPFAAHEEDLQYMSFLHRDIEDSLLVARGDWEEPDRTGRFALAKDGPPSGASTPGQGKAKKISLSAYKNKTKGEQLATSKAGSVEPPVPAEDTKGEAGPPKSHPPQIPSTMPKDLHSSGSMKKEVHTPSTAGKSLPKTKEPEAQTKSGGNQGSQSHRDPVSPSHARKRSAETVEDSKRTQGPSKDNSPAKKRRISSPPIRQETRDKERRTSSPERRQNKLPPLLSPTLPPSIEEELAKLEQHESGSQKESAEKKSSPKTSSPESSKRRESDKASSKPREPAEQASKKEHKSPEKLAASDHTKKPESKPGPKPGKTVVNNNSHTSYFDTLRGQPYKSPSLKPVNNVQADKSVSKKEKLIIRLKYGRDRRKTVERLLKTRPMPNKQPRDVSSLKDEVPDDRHRREEGSKKGQVNPHQDARVKENEKSTKGDIAPPKRPADGAEKRLPRDQPSIGEKRPRASEEAKVQEPAMKRPRAPENTDSSKQPRTPVHATLKSPEKSNVSSAEKGRSNPTPRKAPLSRAISQGDASMARAETPQGTHAEHGESIPTPGVSIDSASDVKLTEMREWRNESKNMGDVGRKLKTEADRLFRQQADEGLGTNSLVYRKGSAVAIESILAFMLSFVADDNSRLVMSEPKYVSIWRTIFPYWDFVEKKTGHMPHLHGFFLQLGAVLREIVHTLERGALSGELQPPAAEKQHYLPENRSKRLKELFQNDRFRETLWRNGQREFAADTIRESYPTTWRRRVRGKSESGSASVRDERLHPGNWGHAYRCPMMSNITTPIEAVRMGAVFLQEWTSMQDIEWRDELGLA